MAGWAPMHVLGLPGNPVSAYVCAVLFLVPLIRRLCRPRRTSSLELEVGTCSAATCRQNDERADYLRAGLDPRTRRDSVATPFPVQDSSMLAPLARSELSLDSRAVCTGGQSRQPCTILKLGRFSDPSSSSLQIKWLRNTYGTYSVCS